MACFTFMSLFVLFLISSAKSSYFEGAPVTFCNKEDDKRCQNEIPLYVNRLNSEKSVIPFEYTHFDFCQASPEERAPAENLGQVVFGERIGPSPYLFKFKKDEKCAKVCTREYKNNDPMSIIKLELLKKGIRMNYQHHWIVDNMPATWCYPVEGGMQYCDTGFPMGCYVDNQGHPKDACVMSPKYSQANTHYIFNHVDLVITYHSADDEKVEWGKNILLNEGEEAGRIISVKAMPMSIDHKELGADENNCEKSFAQGLPMALPQDDAEGKFSIVYSYSVRYVRDDNIAWKVRWDYILESMPHANKTWLSILNSLVIALFLSGMVAMILLCILNKNIAKYFPDNIRKRLQQEVDWKLIHGDVFRPPTRGMLLSALLGSGVQLLLTSITILVFACLGYLSPANRGALGTCALVSYVCLGTPAGYVSSRLYKCFGGKEWEWKFSALLTSTLCPGIVFAQVFVMNLVLWYSRSSAAIPFSTLVALLALWLGVSLPLTFVGSFFGFRKPALRHPVRTNDTPRPIPKQRFYTEQKFGSILGGIPPFCCIVIQLCFILSSIWSSQTYYMYGFLVVVFIFFIISCFMTTILLCYCHLCAKDYRWWWRSFLTSGYTAFYIFTFCVYYFVTKLEIEGAASTFLYFGYTSVMAFLCFLLTGTVGFFACFWFTRKIYSEIQGEIFQADIAPIFKTVESKNYNQLDEKDLGKLTDSKNTKGSLEEHLTKKQICEENVFHCNSPSTAVALVPTDMSGNEKNLIRLLEQE